jgi:hypothetical protein
MKENLEGIMTISKYSLGVGDRFTKEGEAQLQAILKAEQEGIKVAPVWNKSNREHEIIGSLPVHTRIEADEAVSSLGWGHDYFVDADHIGRGNVNKFIEHCDFFTLDVADFIGKLSDELTQKELEEFTDYCLKYEGTLNLQGLDDKLALTRADIINGAGKYLGAVKEAAAIYRVIAEKKGEDNFVTEVSMDETDSPQTPQELFIILAAISQEGIPVQTIAPRFSGRFNKGVDYVGDVEQFTREFEADLAIIAFGIKEFGLPENLKLSVHSGSDKFAIYGPINRAIKKFDTGLHLKTAGTTWLEEAISLAESGGNGLVLVKEIYREALDRYKELTGPYAEVIDIDLGKLPSPKETDLWTEKQFADALRHDQSCPEYNSSLRQMFHVSYKLAAEKGKRFYTALEEARDRVSENVCTNLLERHIKPIFR